MAPSASKIPVLSPLTRSFEPTSYKSLSFFRPFFPSSLLEIEVLKGEDCSLLSLLNCCAIQQKSTLHSATECSHIFSSQTNYC